MIQMVLIKQMVPNSKRRRNVFKSCWNEPRVKPIPLYKKRCYFHESFFESPTPHTRERLSTCVYSITTIKKKIILCAWAAVEGVVSAEGEQSRVLCAGPKGSEAERATSGPWQQQGNFTQRVQAGKQGSGISVPREGSLLPWLPLDLFAHGWILEAARFCWEFWNSSAIRQEKKRSYLLCGGVFVLGFTVVVF